MITATASSNSNSWPVLIVWWVVLGVIYWSPTVIAGTRHVHGLGQVVVVNALLGWTGIGWIVALVMAFRHVEKQAA